MQSFEIIKPIPLLAPYVRHYWVLRDSSSAEVSERTLPVGCVQMIFHRAKQLLIKGADLQPKSFICGQSINFSDVVSTGEIDMITVVFQPYAANVFLRIGANQFFGQNVALDDIGDRELSDLAKRIEDAPNIDLSIYLIEQFLTNRLRALSGYNIERISATLDVINAQSQISVSQLSEVACLGSKQFSRLFVEYVGANPKDFMRVIRMQRALYILQRKPNIPFVELAYECGFSDQSHMIREFKLFSGYTPTEYLSICSPYSDYFSEIE